MKIKFIRKPVNNHFLNYYQDQRIIFGFTEKDFELKDLAIFFQVHANRLVELKQIHSDIICFSSQIESAPLDQMDQKEPIMKGDGIILDELNTMAIIKTADCTPMFFWDDDYSIGGVIHIGWQGLAKGIETKLLSLLEKRYISPDRLHFYLGPAIESRCYEVGQDLYEKFASRWYREKVFSHHEEKSGKYLLDIKKGISLSLQELGVPVERIMDVGICTFCEAGRFPSYRQDKRSGATGENCGRIYNFLLLKPGN
ncbi:MAG: purine-nucleoside/S-methyl-5-thioadenosine phosphorylase / adenosine deaminase [Acidobacteriota bacterium]|nr:purine-nucleoside/S-methyl-5-thioadenosine phosphorylase / adenosine deaminase [Acidobacteriota bacterium]